MYIDHNKNIKKMIIFESRAFPWRTSSCLHDVRPCFLIQKAIFVAGKPYQRTSRHGSQDRLEANEYSRSKDMKTNTPGGKCIYSKGGPLNDFPITYAVYYGQMLHHKLHSRRNGSCSRL